VSGADSYQVKLGAIFTGNSILTLSLAGIDESLKNGLLFSFDKKENSFSVQGKNDSGLVVFDSGNLSCASGGVVLTEGKKHEIEYGLQRYRYEKETEYSRVKMFLAIDGVVLFNQNFDFGSKLALGYFTGGYVAGEKDATVTLSALEENTITTVVTARALKESVAVGQKSAVTYSSSTPYRDTTVKYIFIEGEELATINEYGVVMPTGTGTVKVKVQLLTPYGNFESNEVTIQVVEGEKREDVLAQQAQEQDGLIWVVIGSVAFVAVLCAVAVIIYKHKKKQDNQ
jgi:hypothetical protein